MKKAGFLPRLVTIIKDGFVASMLLAIIKDDFKASRFVAII
jgi:hypothetical protein